MTEHAVDTTRRDRNLLATGAATFLLAAAVFGTYCIACAHPAVVYAG